MHYVHEEFGRNDVKLPISYFLTLLTLGLVLVAGLVVSLLGGRGIPARGTGRSGWSVVTRRVSASRATMGEPPQEYPRKGAPGHWQQQGWERWETQ